LCIEKRENPKKTLFRNIINKEKMNKKKLYNELLNLKAELININNDNVKGLLSERTKANNSYFIYLGGFMYCIKTLLNNK